MFNERAVYRFFAVLSIILFLVCISRLFYLQVINHDFYERLVEVQSNARVTFVKDRGYVYDRNGVILAKNKKVASLYVFGKNIDDVDALISDLQKAGVSLRSDLRRSIKEKDSFIWITRHIDIDKAKSVKRAVPLVDYSLEDSRFYPEGSTLSGVIGHTGVDNQGLSGVEFFADSILKGKVIPVSTIRDSRGKLILFDDGALNTKPDSAVYMSMDMRVQAVVDEILKIDIQNFQAKSAMALAMDVKTGDVIISSAVERRKDLLAVADDKNYATMYLFEPGSIFKAVTFGYLIENNLYKATRTVDTSKQVELYGHRIKDVYPYKSLSQLEVFTKSSNIGTVLLTKNVKNPEIYNFLLKAGFSSKIGIYGAHEESGILRTVDKWSGLSLASLSIGQEIMVTPVQMVRYYAAIANGGVAVNPRFVTGIISDDRFEPTEIKSTKVMEKATADTLLDMLVSVVEKGTGQRAASRMVKIGGKTGTGQLVDPKTGGYSKTDYIASFIGVFPADNPRFAMIVIYESPRTSIYGGATGAATFRKIAEQIAFYYNLGNEKTKVQYAGK